MSEGEGGGKRVQEKMKEKGPGKKSERAQKSKRKKCKELCPPGTKEKLQRKEKGRKRGKLELKTHFPSAHRLSCMQTCYFLFSVFHCVSA